MFRTLTDTLSVSPQIAIADVAEARELGISLIINNRPDGEDPTAPQGAEIKAAAEASGLEYLEIPITHSGFSAPQVDAMQTALAGLAAGNGKALAYCRSGTRSTLLWALAQAKSGKNPAQLSATAAKAGYDLSPVRPMLDALSAGAE